MTCSGITGSIRKACALRRHPSYLGIFKIKYCIDYITQMGITTLQIGTWGHVGYVYGTKSKI